MQFVSGNSRNKKSGVPVLKLKYFVTWCYNFGKILFLWNKPVEYSFKEIYTVLRTFNKLKKKTDEIFAKGFISYSKADNQKFPKKSHESIWKKSLVSLKGF